MRKTRLAHSRLIALLSVGLAACASGAGGPAGEVSAEAEPASDRISIQVTNDLMPGRTVVVWMVPETGSRRRLGSVPPNGRGSFNYLPGIRSMDYRLVAEKDGGGRETSIRFALVGISGVRWQLSDPNVRLVR